MIIDETDLDPQPADDHLSDFPPTKPFPTREHYTRAYSIVQGRIIRRDTHCHQFAIAFHELPHAQ